MISLSADGPRRRGLGAKTRTVVGAVVFVFLLVVQPGLARADLFKWIDRQVDGAPGEDARIIDGLKAGPWQKSIFEREQQVVPGGNQAKAAFGKDEDGYSGTKFQEPEPKATDYKQSDVNLLTDGVTHFRLNRAGLIPEARLETKLNDIAARILAVQPVTDVPIRFVVTGGRGLGDANAMHDGVIGIPIAILADVKSEDEMAFVVAHEISHVILNHHDSDWLSKTNEKLVNFAEVGFTSALEFGAAYGLLGKDDQESLQKKALIGWVASRASLFLTDTALAPSWARDQEIEADLLAFDLLARTDYDAGQGPIFLERLLQYFKESESDPFAARRAELDAQAASQKNFVTAIAGFVGKLTLEIEALTADLEERHPETQERLDSLVDYIDERYEEMEEQLDAREADSSGWGSFLSEPVVAELLTIYRNSWETRNYTSVENFKSAEQKAFASIKGRGSSLALPRLNFADLRGIQGEKNKQLINLEKAVQGPEPSFDVYRQAIRIYRDDGKIQKADALIEDAWLRFKEPAGLYPFRIDAMLRKNDREAAQKLTTTCRLVFRDNSKSCVKASQGKLREWEAEQSAGL